jgi:hypothetical protein
LNVIFIILIILGGKGYICLGWITDPVSYNETQEEVSGLAQEEVNPMY